MDGASPVRRLATESGAQELIAPAPRFNILISCNR